MLKFLSSKVICYDGVTKSVCVHSKHIDKNKTWNGAECQHNNICKKEFDILLYGLPPYCFNNSPPDWKPVHNMLQKCCRGCEKYSVRYFADITAITHSTLNESDLAYPFLATASTVRLFGKYYLPYISKPDIFYITAKQSTIFMSILMLYPLVIICVLLAIISGFISWCFETWCNSLEFPRPFFTGWFEGFWWSFVTITTVGYGDKTPKSTAGKLFSVVWIWVGIISFGILTAFLTTEIMDANSPSPPDMTQKNVGKLRFRDYDEYIISMYGGIAVDAKGNDIVTEVFDLITKLQNKEISGFILDKYTLYYVTILLKRMSNTLYQDRIRYFMEDTMRTKKAVIGKEFTYGILVKDVDVFEYFRHFVNNNRFLVDIQGASLWNKVKRNMTDTKEGTFYSPSNILFASSEYYFRNTIIVLTVMFILICIFGIFFFFFSLWIFFFW